MSAILFGLQRACVPVKPFDIVSQWSHLASWIFIDIASDDDMLPVWRQAISWTNNDFQQSDLIKEIKWNLRWIRKFPYSSMHLNILTVKCHPLWLNLNG